MNILRNKELDVHCFRCPKTFRPYGVVSRFITELAETFQLLFPAIVPDILGAKYVVCPEIFRWPVFSVKSVTGGNQIHNL